MIKSKRAKTPTPIITNKEKFKFSNKNAIIDTFE